MSICRPDLAVTSRKIALERVKLTVASDRLSCTGEEFAQMKQEIADILEKYMKLTECISEIRLDIVYEISRGKKDVKTIQIK